MSASLVGSEMCIRDRLCVSGPFRHAVHMLALRLALGLRPRKQNAHTRSCLLYTSDAADDM
eukprot:13410999-Alexandrium_andersonii.AAC.1